LIKKLSGELLRFIVVGFAATVCDVLVLKALVSGLGWHYLLGNACSFFVGNAVSYLLSVGWVFTERSLSNKTKEFIIFGLIGVGGLGISQACMYASVEWLGLHYMLGKFIAVGATLVWNFVVKKVVLFRARPTGPGRAAAETLSPEA
jgi:putative flippase GtrA